MTSLTFDPWMLFDLIMEMEVAPSSILFLDVLGFCFWCTACFLSISDIMVVITCCRFAFAFVVVTTLALEIDSWC